MVRLTLTVDSQRFYKKAVKYWFITTYDLLSSEIRVKSLTSKETQFASSAWLFREEESAARQEQLRGEATKETEIQIMSERQILLLDHSEVTMECVVHVLTTFIEEVNVTRVSSVDDAIKASARVQHDLLICDHCEAINGLDFIRKFRLTQPQTPIFVASENLDPQFVSDVFGIRGCRVFSKAGASGQLFSPGQENAGRGPGNGRQVPTPTDAFPICSSASRSTLSALSIRPIGKGG